MFIDIAHRKWLRALFCILLLLSGCRPVATSAPTEVAALSATQAFPVATAARPIVASGVPSPPIVSPAQTPAAPPARPTPSPVPTLAPTVPAAPALPVFSYPIGAPGRPLADGFFIRHGVAAENTWYNPGWWHTGEDWYAIEGDTAGARVYSVADGEVVYAGANYPGRVVIVRHAADLFSMYGHLDPDLRVGVGQRVARGTLIGTVLRRGDATPNHLHFEIRTFLTRREVNGAAPRYGYRCGPNCPPGPGYWPIDAPDLPSDLGWRNPTHVIARRMLAEGAVGEVIVATMPASAALTLWSAPPDERERQNVGELRLQPGERYRLLAIHAGPEDARATSALAYVLWYRIALPDGRGGWVQAAVPSSFDTGGDGRPSSVYFNLVPALEAAP